MSTIELFPYQRTGAAWLASKKAALLADQQGVGKSAQAIHACDLADCRRVLVLCPAALKTNWEREFRKFQTLSRDVYIVRSGKAQIKVGFTPIVVVCNYDLARNPAIKAQLSAIAWDALICDEAQRMKSSQANLTKAVLGDKCGRVGGIADKAERLWFLSGTPCPNHPGEIWTAMRALAPEQIPGKDGQPLTYGQFIQRYCVTRETTYGTQVVGSRNLEELRARMKPMMLRRTKDQVLKDLPPLRTAVISLDAGALHNELAKLEKSDEVQQLKAALGDPEAAALVDDFELAPLRRLTGTAKAYAVIPFLQEELEGGLEKIVLFAYHRDVIEILEKGLSDYRPQVIHGGTSAVARQKAVDTFQAEKAARVFIGQIQAAGTGLTLTAAADLMFVEASWVPADNDQAAMRIHRIGQRNACLVRFATLAGSIDEAITRVLERKMKTLSKMFDPS